MSVEGVVEFVVWSLEVYAIHGLVFALLFLPRGLERLDPAVRGSGWGFRLIVLPAVVAFWPLLLHRWRRARRGAAYPPIETNAHRRAAGRRAR